MPQLPADEPLKKISVKIFESDFDWLENTFGYGWSSIIRTIVRKFRTKREEEIDEQHR